MIYFLDFWTGDTLHGGRPLDRATPIDILPLYVRAGAILPWGPKGLRSEIGFRWNDKTRTLTIEDRKGSFPGMLSSRKFMIVVGKVRKTVECKGSPAKNDLLYCLKK